MSKQLIGALVGALLLFIWQFLSWSMLNIHSAEQTYTPNQDKIIEALSANLDADGMYQIPYPAPGEDHEAFQQKMEGKPWATVNFHQKWELNFGMNLFRGFAIDFAAVFLLVWMLMKFERNDMVTSVMASMAVGLIGYFSIIYLNHIWYKIPTMGYLIDAVASWGLVGAWLGWWLNR